MISTHAVSTIVMVESRSWYVGVSITCTCTCMKFAWITPSTPTTTSPTSHGTAWGPSTLSPHVARGQSRFQPKYSRNVVKFQANMCGSVATSKLIRQGLQCSQS